MGSAPEEAAMLRSCSGVLGRDDDAAVGRGRRLGALDQLLNIGHRPASVRVLRTFTLRNNAAGQPCDTAATWPGCPLPQFGVPHNVH